MKIKFKLRSSLVIALNIVYIGAFGQLSNSSPADSIKVNVRSAATTFTELMVTKPAVQVIQSGTLGNASQLLIRGVGSINSNASPYIYVDGIPVRYSRFLPSFLSVYQSSRFNFLNPHDIKSIEVRTEGFSLSEIGGRGANGAVYIETDRGELGGTKIDFSAKFGVQTADYNIARMGPNKFKNYLRSYYLENGASESEVNQYPVFDPTLAVYNNNTDWMGLIMRNSSLADYNLKLKGGDGDAQYMFSLGYIGKDGTTKGADLSQINLRFNLDYKLSPKIDVVNSLAYTNATFRYAEEGFNYGIHPIFVAATKAPFLNPYLISPSGELTNQLTTVDEFGKSNPLSLVDNMYNKNEDNRIDGKIQANLLLAPKTYLHSSFVFNYMNLTERQFRPAFGIIQDFDRVRQNRKRNSSETMLLSNTWIDKTGSFGKALQYLGMAGLSYESYDEKSLFARKSNAGSDDYETLEQGTIDSASNLAYSSQLLTFYMRGNVDFFNRIKIAANLNVEATSNFGTAGRWGLYPGISSVIDVLKRTNTGQLALRAGWGRTGNNDLRGYYHHNLYAAANYYGYGGVYLGNIANSAIKPEVTDTYDAGITLGLFNRRVTLDGGFYYKDTDQLITQRTVPIELGLDPQFENNGRMVSQGFELSLNAKLIKKKQFSWSVFGNVSTLENVVKELPNGNIVKSIGGVNTVAKVNEALGSFYGYNILGVFASTASVNLQKADGTNFKAGDYIVEDVNKDLRINELDRQVIGSALPEAFGNFGTFLNYKKVSFNAVFTYSVGNDIYNSFNQQMHSMKDFSNQSPEVDARWISETNQGTGLSRAAIDDPSSNTATSNLWVEDGSYLRLKNITINYEIPLPEKMRIFRAMNVYVSAENLLTFTKYSGMDPEVITSPDPMFRGIDFGASPLPQTYMLGFKMSF